MSGSLRRPQSIEEMLVRLRAFRTPEALEYGLSLQVEPDDVIISTYPKSGTTWLQHVVHGLRSGGSMEFEEISQVVPWIESALDMGIDPTAEQPWSPRVFKAHLEWERVPKGGRYITAFRDPASVLPSFYRFFEGWFFEPGTISLETFARDWFMAGTASGRYWDHIVSWAPLAGRSDVLVLTYEDMAEAADDLPAALAEYLELDVSQSMLAKVGRQSTREFMSAHPTKFDEHLIRNARDAEWELPSGGSSAKVQVSATRLEIGDELRAELAAIWRSEVEPKLGHATYEDLRNALPDPLGVR